MFISNIKKCLSLINKKIFINILGLILLPSIAFAVEPETTIENRNTGILKDFKAGITANMGAVLKFLGGYGYDKGYSKDQKDKEIRQSTIAKNDLLFGLSLYQVYRPNVHVGMYFDLGWNYYQIQIVDIKEEFFYNTEKDKDGKKERGSEIKSKYRKSNELYKYKINQLSSKIAIRWYPIWVPSMYLSFGMSFSSNFNVSLTKFLQETKAKSVSAKEKKIDNQESDDISNIEVGHYLSIGFETDYIFLELFTASSFMSKFEMDKNSEFDREIIFTNFAIKLGVNLLEYF